MVLLTTDTTHHLYFAWKLNEQFPLRAIVLERERPLPPFETFHPLEKLRDDYERAILLAGGPPSWTDVTEIRECKCVNDADALAAIHNFRPEIIIVFGTGKLAEQLISAASEACLNLHGGNPEHYRGLDTHLWTIYHEDFENLVTTLHHVDSGIDTGDIVFQAALVFDRKTELQELRAINTKACVQLSLLALHSLRTQGLLPCRKQVQRGRYYSFMPSALKEECLRKFRRHTDKL